MKKVIAAFFVCLICASASGISAQKRNKPFSEEDRRRFRTEMRAYKHQFLAHELELSKEQQRDFFAVYDEMDDEIERINFETRDLERRVSSKEDATDVELEAAARAVYGQKKAEGDVEAAYYERFKQFLSPRQLLKLRQAERSFTQKLMRHHRRAKNAANEK